MYALPNWFQGSAENKGFKCLEHGLSNEIQSVFRGVQDKYVERILTWFVAHHGSRKTLLGIRLGLPTHTPQPGLPAYSIAFR